nr:hypothetical protein [Candidatus Sigynarchaeota archaeon]
MAVFSREAVTIMIQCGQGLEPCCLHELNTKFPGIHVEQNPFGLKGYVSVKIDNTPALLARGVKIVNTLRCFEKMHILMQAREVPWEMIPRKDRVEQKIADFFDDALSIMPKTGFLRIYGNLAGVAQTPIKEIEITVPVPGFLKAYGFNQAQIQAIGKKKARDHGISLVLKKKGIPLLYVKIQPQSIIGLMLLERPPGNFRLRHVHPTSLFPNYAFALIQESFVAYWEANPARPGTTINIVDPFSGAGTIPLMAWQEREYLARILGTETDSLAFTGFEKDPDFFSKVRANSEELTTDPSFTLMNKDFLESGPGFHADMFITQPPYGLSINIEKDQLYSLYKTLFSWSDTNGNHGAILGIISPHTKWISEISKNTRWHLVKSIPVKEHSVDCTMDIFKLVF